VFFYQAQREHARSLVRVPFTSLPPGPASPALLFSVGRCGSTLLVRVLQAAGVRAVSEPDFYTQAACMEPLDLSLRGAIAGATALLRCAVVKLRLECNNAPLLIAGAFETPRIMFILRHPIDWAASLRRLSRNSLDLGWALGRLRSSLLGLEQLARSYPVRVLYYEDFRTLAPGAVADALEWAGHSGGIPPEKLKRLAERDAQDGTVVSRASVRNVPDDAPFRAAFGREWARLRPAEVIDRLQLKFL